LQDADGVSREHLAECLCYRRAPVLDSA